MREQTLKEAQDYLTIVDKGKAKRILDIETLVKRHEKEMILSFMEGLLKEKEKTLKGLVVKDKTAYRVNETIGAMFRIYMAMKTLEREETR